MTNSGKIIDKRGGGPKTLDFRPPPNDEISDFANIVVKC